MKIFNDFKLKSPFNLIFGHYLRYRIILIVFISILFPSVFFFSYMYTFINDHFYARYVNTTVTQSTNHIEDSIVNNLRIIENSYQYLISGQSLRENLYNQKNDSPSYYNDQLIKLNIETEMKYIMANDYGFKSGLIDSVFIFSNEINYYYLLYNYLPNESLQNQALDFYKTHSHQDSDIVSYDEINNSIYYMKTINDYVTGDVLGHALLNINMFKLKGEYIQEDYKDFIIIVYDSENIIRYHTDPSQIGQPIQIDPSIITSSYQEVVIDNKSYITMSKHINDLGIELVTYSPAQYFKEDIWSVLPDYVYFIMISVLISIIVGIYFVTYITEPLKEITLTISDVSNSNFKEKIPSYKYTELNDLSSAYNKMIDQIQYLFNEVYEKQILVRESELKALHAQINPHFIFNVLESITWEARMSENEKIEQMITALGQLLRSNLSFSDKEKCSLEQELDYVNFYLYLQNVRFKERLSYSLDIESDELLNYYLPKFSLQTLVENAIIHGIEKKTTPGHLTIRIYEDEADVWMIVKDDGIGFDTKDIDLNQVQTDKYTNSHHIGLFNVNRRIELLYGKSYGVTLQSIINQGTKAIIQLPKDKGI